VTTQEHQAQIDTAAPAVVRTVPTLRQPRRIRGHLVGPIAVLVVVFLVYEIARNEAFDWSAVRRYLFDRNILLGLWRTVQLSVLSMLLGTLLSLVIAQMRMSRYRAWRHISAAYVWFFRAMPALILLILIYNIGLIWPTIEFGIPFVHSFSSVPTQEYIKPFTAAIIAFALNESAYGSEIIRASILSVPKGQTEAAHALGMTQWQTYRRVVMPQAMRVALPPLSNDLVNVVKGTALVAFISVSDLLYSAQLIYSRTFEVIPLLVVVSIWYLVIVTVITVLQAYLERRLSRSALRARAGQSTTAGAAR
jgi:polar amino acid transport system permease protein